MAQAWYSHLQGYYSYLNKLGLVRYKATMIIY